MKNILIIGDVVGKCGREILFKELQNIIDENDIFFTVVNGENATTGNGITEKYANKILEAGADVITLGNHSFDKQDLYKMLDSDLRIIRPLNYPPEKPGDGLTVIKKDGIEIAVINLIGRTYLDDSLACPFETLEKTVNKLRDIRGIKNIIVDFHAEATSEKEALGFFMDGKVTFLYGTHTHVQTNDPTILKGETGYLTDVGMTGSKYSVIGLQNEIAIPRFLGDTKKSFKWGEEMPMINGAIVTIDETSGTTHAIKLLNKIYN